MKSRKMQNDNEELQKKFWSVKSQALKLRNLLKKHLLISFLLTSFILVIIKTSLNVYKFLQEQYWFQTKVCPKAITKHINKITKNCQIWY